jgi:small-conductance mechanosensitive channel
VDLHERQQLAAVREGAAKVKARFRPWRSIFILGLAVIMGAVSRSARTAAASPEFDGTFFHALGRGGTGLAAGGAAVAFCLLGLLGTTGIAKAARDALRPKIGNAHSAVVRYAIVLTGSLVVILITLQLFGISVTQLLLGGAFATVLLGLAGQQSLSNICAGVVLLLARPVDIGDRVSVRSGPMGGELTGTVTEIGLLYVRLDTSSGLVNLPNEQVLGAAVAQAADADAKQDESPGHPANAHTEAAGKR